MEARVFAVLTNLDVTQFPMAHKWRPTDKIKESAGAVIHYERETTQPQANALIIELIQLRCPRPYRFVIDSDVRLLAETSRLLSPLATFNQSASVEEALASLAEECNIPDLAVVA